MKINVNNKKNNKKYNLLKIEIDKDKLDHVGKFLFFFIFRIERNFKKTLNKYN